MPTGTPYTEHFTLYIDHVHRTVIFRSSLHKSTPYIDHVQLYIDLACPQVHRTPNTLHCTLTMYIEQLYLDLACPQVHRTLYTLHCTFYTLHFSLTTGTPYILHHVQVYIDKVNKY